MVLSHARLPVPPQAHRDIIQLLFLPDLPQKRRHIAQPFLFRQTHHQRVQIAAQDHTPIPGPSTATRQIAGGLQSTKAW